MSGTGYLALVVLANSMLGAPVLVDNILGLEVAGKPGIADRIVEAVPDSTVAVEPVDIESEAAGLVSGLAAVPVGIVVAQGPAAASPAVADIRKTAAPAGDSNLLAAAGSAAHMIVGAWSEKLGPDFDLERVNPDFRRCSRG